jgi:asparagine synthetase B (glutamine-hydrolysing)
MLTHRSSPVKRLLSQVLPPFSKTGQSLHRRAATGVERYLTALRPFTPRQKRALFAPEFAPQDYDDLWHVRRYWREDLEILKRLQWADIHTHLPGAYLTKVDRASMAHSLEVRPPLLDHRVVEFALSLDPALLRDVEGGRGKLIVRRLMEDRVPEGLFDLPKRGFGVPAGAWTRKRPALLRGALERLRRAGIVRRDARVRLRGNQTWLLLVLDRWMNQAGLL